MANVTKAQLTILVEQLERQVEDDRRRIGVMMYEANVMTQRINELEVEVIKLEESVESYQDRCDGLEAIVAAAKPVSQPKKPSPKPVPTEVAESSPVVEVSDFDKAMYRKFKELDRTERLAIIAFARPKFGHVGLHNIIAVRSAWHELMQDMDAAAELG